jgi:uncharacterized protein
MSAVLQEVAHRPWPLPGGPWVMAQTWHDLLFAHWPVEAAALRQLIPPQLLSCTEHQGWIHYQSERIHRGAPAALLIGRYRPVGDAVSPQPEALEHFLTERYCLYAMDARGQIIRGEIHHPPWPLQPAEAEFACNSMSESLGIALTPQPLLHFAPRQHVLVWPPRKIA